MPHHLVAGTTLTTELDLGVPNATTASDDGWTLASVDASPSSPGAVELNRTRQDDGSTWSVLERVGDGYVLRFPDLVTFRIDPIAGLVRFEVHDDHPATLRHLVLDQLTPHLLALRGALVLHASGVSIDGRGIAIVGPSGMGKSTLAGALVQRGAQLLADDFLVLDERDGGWWARPAYPGLRVWDDSATALGPDGGAGPVSGYSDKQRWVPDAAAVAPDPVPLQVAVVLAEGDAARPPSMEPLPGTGAYMALFEQAFRVERRGRGRLEDELDRFERLVRTVAVHRLEQRYDWDDLEQVAELVEGTVG